ncbi:MAG: hypothetical protein JO151_15630 [Verrucomicrobia bacterium]|nr:hypothetical protein [Verrucomicrobiota bacterium]
MADWLLSVGRPSELAAEGEELAEGVGAAGGAEGEEVVTGVAVGLLMGVAVGLVAGVSATVGEDKGVALEAGLGD